LSMAPSIPLGAFRRAVPEVWFRMKHLSADDVNGSAQLREQTVEVALEPEGQFQNGNDVAGGMCENPVIMRQGATRVRFRRVLLDAAYDAEKTHVLVRERLGAESIIPTKTCRGAKTPPTGKYPWMMYDALSSDRLKPARCGQVKAGQKCEGYLCVLVHSLIILPTFKEVFNEGRSLDACG